MPHIASGHERHLTGQTNGKGKQLDYLIFLIGIKAGINFLVLV